MDIKEIKELKKEVESQISKIIEDFQERSSLVVKDIDYTFVQDLTGKATPFRLKLVIDLDF